MRSTIVPAAIAVAALLAAGCSTQQMAAEARLEAQKRQVLLVEDEYVAAEVSRDEPALRRLVDDRFVNNLSSGRTTGKEELIQSLLKMSMVGQTLRERSVLLVGDVALVFGTADLRFSGPEGRERVTSLRYTSTYVNRQGQWRILALQMQPRAKE